MCVCAHTLRAHTCPYMPTYAPSHPHAQIDKWIAQIDKWIDK